MIGLEANKFKTLLTATMKGMDIASIGKSGVRNVHRLLLRLATCLLG